YVCFICHEITKGTVLAPFEYIRRIYNIIFYILPGNIVIYSIYEPNYNKNMTQPDVYCNTTLYLFAFCFTVVTYILLALLFLAFCVLLLSYCCRKQREADDDNTRSLLRG
uniref:Uncharacterized protein n=1 Tax=Maylandia zebra TaxID=106582 RepID=A0A3P9D277_9CICH